MDLNGEFYILVEGEPNSPEVEFLNNLIQNVFNNHGLGDIIPRIIEVGGSSSFETFAKVCYRLSNIHKKIPVLAISDRDYRVDFTIYDDSYFIKERKPKILYWQKHEWENYLLYDLQFVLDWLNKLPITHKDSKISRGNQSPSLSINDIENDLLRYFRSVVKDEFWECLKFNLSVKIKKYPSVTKPDNFSSWSLEEIQEWFDSESQKTNAQFKLTPKPKDLFSKIIEQFSWALELNTHDNIFLNKGKEIFRGKESFSYVYKKLNEHFTLHNLEEDTLKKKICGYWIDQKTNSKIYRDIEDILITALKNTHH